MTLVFAYIASLHHAATLPIWLYYRTEIGFALVAIGCLAVRVSGVAPRGWGWSLALALIGGVCGAFALVMPFELAPIFFGVSPEIMLVTWFIAPFAYLVLSAMFVFGMLVVRR